jgi:hypothetical protein
MQCASRKLTKSYNVARFVTTLPTSGNAARWASSRASAVVVPRAPCPVPCVPCAVPGSTVRAPCPSDRVWLCR